MGTIVIQQRAARKEARVAKVEMGSLFSLVTVGTADAMAILPEAWCEMRIERALR